MLKNNYIPVLTLRGIGSTIPSPKKREQNTQTTLETLPQATGEHGVQRYDVLHIPLQLQCPLKWKTDYNQLPPLPLNTCSSVRPTHSLLCPRKVGFPEVETLILYVQEGGSLQGKQSFAR